MCSQDPGHHRAIEGITAWDQLPWGDAWPTWGCAPTVHPALGSPSTRTRQAHTALNCGNSWVIHPFQGLPTHTSGACLQCPSLSTFSLVAQSVKKLPAMQETWVQSLGWVGRSPGEGNGNPLQYSCLENPMNRGAWSTVHGVAKSWTQLSDRHFDFPSPKLKWAWISGQFHPFMSGWRSDTEEKLANRGGQPKQRKEGGTAPEVAGARLKPRSQTETVHLRGNCIRWNNYSWNKEISDTELTPHCPQQLQRHS